MALAQQAPQSGADLSASSDGSEIIVTAQKRSENLQNVPIAIQALTSAKLDQLNVTNFNSYTQQLPSIVSQSAGTPGTNVIYMRGVASGGDGNHSGSQPSVGVYLDEQPVTTIGGNLDVHVYDIARIESLAGPQGTLYGASSEAGTIRIITNKPDATGFSASVDSQINTVEKGGQGGNIEGMVNIPLSPRAAVRVVGFYRKDAGYIDNVAGTRCFLPTPGGICVNNAALVKNNFNDTDVYGGRAALKVDLDDNWTVTPSAMIQETKSHGIYSFDPSVGDLQVQRFFPDFRNDRFWQGALTIEGKIGSWDLTSATAYLDRKTSSSSDYTDYAEAYDSIYAASGGVAGYLYFQDAAGKTIDSRQKVIGGDHFKMFSQELRVASPADQPVRLVAGAFYQFQSNDIEQDYQVAGLAPLLSVNGRAGTLWLTQQHRVDKNYAAFGELSWDIASTLTLTAGGRLFKYDNSLVGFFGFGRDPAFVQGADNANPPNGVGSTRTGVAGCFTQSGVRLREAQLAGQADTTLLPPEVAGGPCTNLGTFANGEVNPVRAKGDGVTWRFNGTWKPQQGLLFYATASRGFRPGGNNRRGDFGDYKPDYLVNYELGAKVKLGAMRLNAALYQQEWKNFQFSYLGPNSFTVITNGPNARIRGFDVDATFQLERLNINIAAAYTDAKTRNNLCRTVEQGVNCTGADVQAPAGTRLPITPQLKMAGTARYTAPVGAAKVYGQFNFAYQSEASSDLRVAFAARQGRLPAFGTVNLAIGSDWTNYSVELFASNIFDVRGQLSRSVSCGACTDRPYIFPTAPRTIGLRTGAKF
ncbi:TonB-dependent receptor [Novosphingobium sp. PASSN1]|uniref:TonB-dependent receptor n=1 Tax=Novosphingobium sp. PASSN1 TaxID=2015561 RepID=UPI0025FD8741|nr:TonB-dependent receptor [Novosphingobium sp. PASSN1]